MRAIVMSLAVLVAMASPSMAQVCIAPTADTVFQVPGNESCVGQYGPGFYAASSGGLRRAHWQFLDADFDDFSTAVISMDLLSDPYPPPGVCVQRTGAHIKTYFPADNGCDNSGLLVTSTGGGSGISVFKLSHVNRPPGYPDLSDSPQGALEAGTSDQSQAIYAVSGWGGSLLPSNTMVHAIGGPQAKGEIYGAADGQFDRRKAWSIGCQQRGQPDDGCQQAFVRLDGSSYFGAVSIKPIGYTQGTTDIPLDAGVAICHPTTSGDVTMRLPHSNQNQGLIVHIIRPVGNAPQCIVSTQPGDNITGLSSIALVGAWSKATLYATGYAGWARID